MTQVESFLLAREAFFLMNGRESPINGLNPATNDQARRSSGGVR
jgi:hypothetical protein